MQILKSTKELSEAGTSQKTLTVEELNLKPLSLVQNKENDEKEKKKNFLLSKKEIYYNKEYNQVIKIPLILIICNFICFLQDIWQYLRELEGNLEWPKFNYMRKQVHLNFKMRSILVDWLVAVALEYEMNEQTLHLAVNFIDRFLSHMSVVSHI